MLTYIAAGIFLGVWAFGAFFAWAVIRAGAKADRIEAEIVAEYLRLRAEADETLARLNERGQ